MSPSVVKDLLIGATIAGRYEVVRRIGGGGMGSVYEVAHTRLRRRFAMKTVSAELSDDAQALARFQREADVVAGLHHPNIVDIVDWEVMDDGTPCLIMEYLRGETLAERLKRSGPLSWTVLGRIADQVLSALSVAHRAGVIHRDLKPHNIFLAQDDTGAERAKLLDFGVSKVRDSQSTLTGQQQLIGTPAHMSPEQVEGDTDKIGPASDVWAMGTILFEMATARRAFAAPSLPSFLYRICHGAPDSVLAGRPDSPPAFVALIERTLSRDVLVRIVESGDLRRELRLALEPVAPGAFVDELRPDEDSELDETTTIHTTVYERASSQHDANGTVDETTPVPMQPQPHQGTPTTLSRAASQVTPYPHFSPYRTTSRAKKLVVAMAVIAGFGGLAALGIFLGGDNRGRGPEHPTPAAGVAEETSSPDAAESLPAPTTLAVFDAQVPVREVVAATPADAGTAPASPQEDAAAASPVPSYVELALDSVPRGAEVRSEKGGPSLGKTPFSEKRERSDVKITYLLERPGYREASVGFVPNRDQSQKVVLVKARPKKSTHKVRRRKPHTKRHTPQKPKVESPAPAENKEWKPGDPLDVQIQ